MCKIKVKVSERERESRYEAERNLCNKDERKEGGSDSENERQIDVISQDRVCLEPLSTVFGRVTDLLFILIWFPSRFLFLENRLDFHSIRSKAYGYVKLGPTEALKGQV